jgi:hypothetical protein
VHGSGKLPRDPLPFGSFERGIMSSTSNAVPYLIGLSAGPRIRSGSKRCAAIEEKGHWVAFVEWRISTVTELKVHPIKNPVDKHGPNWFEVTVKCDSEHICHCPTIERGVEFLGIFERLVSDLFWSVGWPSWATPRQMKP